MTDIGRTGKQFNNGKKGRISSIDTTGRLVLKIHAVPERNSTPGPAPASTASRALIGRRVLLVIRSRPCDGGTRYVQAPARYKK